MINSRHISKRMEISGKFYAHTHTPMRLFIYPPKTFSLFVNRSMTTDEGALFPPGRGNNWRKMLENRRRDATPFTLRRPMKFRRAGFRFGFLVYAGVTGVSYRIGSPNERRAAQRDRHGDGDGSGSGSGGSTGRCQCKAGGFPWKPINLLISSPSLILLGVSRTAQRKRQTEGAGGEGESGE